MNSTQFGKLFRLERIPLDVDATRAYRQIGIRSFGKGIFYRDPLNANELSKLRYFHVNPGRIVFSNIMAWEGAVGVTGPEAEGCVGSQRFLSYAPLSDQVDLRYYNYFFQSTAGMGLIRSGSTGTVKRNQTLSPRTIDSFEVPLPSLDEQRQISRTLADAFSRSDAAESLIAYRENGLSAMFPDFVDATIDRFPSRATPVGRQVQLVNDVVRPGDDRGEADEFVGLEHVARNLGVKLSSRPVGDETGRKFRFRKGDLLYGYLRPYQNKVWFASHPGLCSVEQFVLRTNNPKMTRYIGYVLRGRRILDKVQTLTNNLQLPRLSSKALLALEVPIVPDRLLDEAVASLGQLNDKVVETWLRSQEAALTISSLKPALLSALFCG